MPERPLLTVCRGCCCGSDSSTDAVRLLERLRDGCGEVARIRTSECLGPCERSDVVVVTPSPSARAGGARTVWVARVISDGVVDALAAWAADGGPGVADLPAAVRARVFRVERARVEGPSHSGLQTERTERT